MSYALFPYLIASFPIFPLFFRSFRISLLKMLFSLSRPTPGADYGIIQGVLNGCIVVVIVSVGVVVSVVVVL